MAPIRRLPDLSFTTDQGIRAYSPFETLALPGLRPYVREPDPATRECRLDFASPRNEDDVNDLWYRPTSLGRFWGFTQAEIR